MESEETVQAELTREEKHLRSLDKMCLMDDPVFSEALNDKTESVQYMLNVILERSDFTVIRAHTQVSHSSALRRSVRFDIEAQTDSGQIMDIEVQRHAEGTEARRARFYSGKIDQDLLNKGDDYDKLKETWVIFIMGRDPYDAGLPMYHIDRTIKELNGMDYGDEAHIIYVNGEFQDISHPVGRLMHDFHCIKADDMLNPLLAEDLRNLKETEGGRRHMSGIMQELCEDAEHRQKLQVVRNLIALGKLTYEEIAACTDLTLDEVLAEAGKKSA